MEAKHFNIIIIAIFGFAGDSYSAPPLWEKATNFKNYEEIVPLYRLPENVIPTHYTIELQPILDEGFGTRFTSPGKVWINVTCQAATKNITLHALNLNISQSSVKVIERPGDTALPISVTDVEPAKDFFIISMENDLNAATNYQIYIEFVAQVNRDVLLGLFASSYVASDGSTKYIAVTDLEATDARRVFPCFDEPQMKATFDIMIIRRTPYHALSNMNLLRTETNVPGLAGWVKDVFATTEKMSTYIFCVAVSEYEMEEASPGHFSKPVKIWGPPSYMRIGAGKYSPDVAAKLMAALENYFDVPYTFPKMDKIAIPQFSGAMENWGLNTYRLSLLLLEDGIATAADKISTTEVMSHELVHQWFGNIVTMKWWDDLWLNEGFASYYSNVAMTYIGVQDMLPLDTLVPGTVQRAMYYDLTPSTHPVHYTVETPTEIRIMFDAATYSKGASLVRMLDRSILGETLMKSGLTKYLQKHQHSNAHQDDLFQCLQEEIDASSETILPDDVTLKEIMDAWTLQSGFPVISITRTPGSPSIMLSQAKMKNDVLDEADLTAEWHIPISVYLSSDSELNTRAKTWLKIGQPLQFVTVGTVDYFIINPQQVGFYRVKYDNYSLGQIIEQLLKDHEKIDPQSRSALIDDNLNLAYAGYVSLTDALNLTLYLKNERHLVPWTSFVTNMAKPYRFLARTGGIAGFSKYVVSLLKDTLTEIAIDPQPSEPIGSHTILRNKLFEWACNLGDSDCVQYSKEKFAEWMTDPTNNTIIFPDLRPFVYCTAVANGGNTEWEFALSQYGAANRDVTKVNLIRSLGCSNSVYRLTMLLNLAINETSVIENVHRVTAMQAVAGNSVGADIAFNFIRNNFDTIRQKFGVSLFASVISTLSNTLNKVFDVTDLQRFIGDNEAVLAPVNSTLQTAIFNIQNNIKWMNRNANEFRNFVEKL